MSYDCIRSHTTGCGFKQERDKCFSHKHSLKLSNGERSVDAAQCVGRLSLLLCLS